MNCGASKIWRLIFITTLMPILTRANRNEDLRPSVSCLIIGDYGCKFRCTLLCKLYGCVDWNPTCEGVYCDCREQWEPVTIEPDMVDEFAGLETFDDIMSVKFEQTPVFDELKETMRENPNLQDEVVYFLRHTRGRGKPLTDQLRQAFPQLDHLLRRLTPRTFTQQKRSSQEKPEVPNEPLGNLDPPTSRWGFLTNWWNKPSAPDNTQHNKDRIIDMVNKIEKKEDLLNTLQMLKDSGDTPLYTNVVQHFLQNGLILADGARILEPISDSKILKNSLENDEIFRAIKDKIRVEEKLKKAKEQQKLLASQTQKKQLSSDTNKESQPQKTESSFWGLSSWFSPKFTGSEPPKVEEASILPSVPLSQAAQSVNAGNLRTELPPDNNKNQQYSHYDDKTNFSNKNDNSFKQSNNTSTGAGWLNFFWKKDDQLLASPEKENKSDVIGSESLLPLKNNPHLITPNTDKKSDETLFADFSSDIFQEIPNSQITPYTSKKSDKTSFADFSSDIFQEIPNSQITPYTSKKLDKTSFADFSSDIFQEIPNSQITPYTSIKSDEASFTDFSADVFQETPYEQKFSPSTGALNKNQKNIKPLPDSIHLESFSSDESSDNRNINFFFSKLAPEKSTEQTMLPSFTPIVDSSLSQYEDSGENDINDTLKNYFTQANVEIDNSIFKADNIDITNMGIQNFNEVYDNSQFSDIVSSGLLKESPYESDEDSSLDIDYVIQRTHLSRLRGAISDSLESLEITPMENITQPKKLIKEENSTNLFDESDLAPPQTILIHGGPGSPILQIDGLPIQSSNRDQKKKNNNQLPPMEEQMSISNEGPNSNNFFASVATAPLKKENGFKDDLDSSLYLELFDTNESEDLLDNTTYDRQKYAPDNVLGMTTIFENSPQTEIPNKHKVDKVTELPSKIQTINPKTSKVSDPGSDNSYKPFTTEKYTLFTGSPDLDDLSISTSTTLTKNGLFKPQNEDFNYSNSLLEMNNLDSLDIGNVFGNNRQDNIIPTDALNDYSELGNISKVTESSGPTLVYGMSSGKKQKTPTNALLNHNTTLSPQNNNNGKNHQSLLIPNETDLSFFNDKSDFNNSNRRASSELESKNKSQLSDKDFNLKSFLEIGKYNGLDDSVDQLDEVTNNALGNEKQREKVSTDKLENNEKFSNNSNHAGRKQTFVNIDKVADKNKIPSDIKFSIDNETGEILSIVVPADKNDYDTNNSAIPDNQISSNSEITEKVPNKGHPVWVNNTLFESPLSNIQIFNSSSEPYSLTKPISFQPAKTTLPQNKIDSTISLKNNADNTGSPLGKLPVNNIEKKIDDLTTSIPNKITINSSPHLFEESKHFTLGNNHPEISNITTKPTKYNTINSFDDGNYSFKPNQQQIPTYPKHQKLQTNLQSQIKSSLPVLNNEPMSVKTNGVSSNIIPAQNIDMNGTQISPFNGQTFLKNDLTEETPMKTSLDSLVEAKFSSNKKTTPSIVHSIANQPKTSELILKESSNILPEPVTSTILMDILKLDDSNTSLELDSSEDWMHNFSKENTSNVLIKSSSEPNVVQKLNSSPLINSLYQQNKMESKKQPTDNIQKKVNVLANSIPDKTENNSAAYLFEEDELFTLGNSQPAILEITTKPINYNTFNSFNDGDYSSRLNQQQVPIYPKLQKLQTNLPSQINPSLPVLNNEPISTKTNAISSNTIPGKNSNINGTPKSLLNNELLLKNDITEKKQTKKSTETESPNSSSININPINISSVKNQPKISGLKLKETSNVLPEPTLMDILKVDDLNVSEFDFTEEWVNNLSGGKLSNSPIKVSSEPDLVKKQISPQLVKIPSQQNIPDLQTTIKNNPYLGSLMGKAAADNIQQKINNFVTDIPNKIESNSSPHLFEESELFTLENNHPETSKITTKPTNYNTINSFDNDDYFFKTNQQQIPTYSKPQKLQPSLSLPNNKAMPAETNAVLSNMMPAKNTNKNDTPISSLNNQFFSKNDTTEKRPTKKLTEADSSNTPNINTTPISNNSATNQPKTSGLKYKEPSNTLSEPTLMDIIKLDDLNASEFDFTEEWVNNLSGGKLSNSPIKVSSEPDLVKKQISPQLVKIPSQQNIPDLQTTIKNNPYLGSLMGKAAADNIQQKINNFVTDIPNKIESNSSPHLFEESELFTLENNYPETSKIKTKPTNYNTINSFDNDDYSSKSNQQQIPTYSKPQKLQPSLSLPNNKAMPAETNAVLSNMMPAKNTNKNDTPISSLNNQFFSKNNTTEERPTKKLTEADSSNTPNINTTPISNNSTTNQPKTSGLKYKEPSNTLSEPTLMDILKLDDLNASEFDFTEEWVNNLSGGKLSSSPIQVSSEPDLVKKQISPQLVKIPSPQNTPDLQTTIKNNPYSESLMAKPTTDNIRQKINNLTNSIPNKILSNSSPYLFEEDERFTLGNDQSLKPKVTTKPTIHSTIDPYNSPIGQFDDHIFSKTDITETIPATKENSIPLVGTKSSKSSSKIGTSNNSDSEINHLNTSGLKFNEPSNVLPKPSASLVDILKLNTLDPILELDSNEERLNNLSGDQPPNIPIMDSLGPNIIKAPISPQPVRIPIQQNTTKSQPSLGNKSNIEWKQPADKIQQKINNLTSDVSDKVETDLFSYLFEDTKPFTLGNNKVLKPTTTIKPTNNIIDLLKSGSQSSKVSQQQVPNNLEQQKLPANLKLQTEPLSMASTSKPTPTNEILLTKPSDFEFNDPYSIFNEEEVIDASSSQPSSQANKMTSFNFDDLNKLYLLTEDDEFTEQEIMLASRNPKIRPDITRSTQNIKDPTKPSIKKPQKPNFSSKTS